MEPIVKIVVQTAKLTVIQLTTCVREEPNVKAKTAAISVPTKIGARSARPGIPYRSQIFLDLVSCLEGAVIPFAFLLFSPYVKLLKEKS